MNNLKNKVQLIGNLGQDPEIKKLDNGSSLARIRIATNEVYNNKKGERVTETQWHNCVAWDKLAERAETYLKKGSEIAIQGKLVHRNYKDKEGNTRYTSEIQVKEFMMLGKRVAQSA